MESHDNIRKIRNHFLWLLFGIVFLQELLVSFSIRIFRCFLFRLFFIYLFCALFLCHSSVFFMGFCYFNRFPVKETWQIVIALCWFAISLFFVCVIWNCCCHFPFSERKICRFNFCYDKCSSLGGCYLKETKNKKKLAINKTNLSTIKVQKYEVKPVWESIFLLTFFFFKSDAIKKAQFQEANNNEKKTRPHFVCVCVLTEYLFVKSNLIHFIFWRWQFLVLCDCWRYTFPVIACKLHHFLYVAEMHFAFSMSIPIIFQHFTVTQYFGPPFVINFTGNYRDYQQIYYIALVKTILKRLYTPTDSISFW